MEGRHGPPQPVRHALDPIRQQRREAHVSRVRSRRASRTSIDELRPGRAFGITATMMAWCILVVGIVIAVVGTVQAMRMAGDEPQPAPLAEAEALTKQIEELKIDLDRERAEKQDLLQKLAAVQSLAAPSTSAAIPGVKADVTVPAEEQALEDEEPAPTGAENGVSVTASQAAPAATAVSSEQPLPAPMAPSAELLEPTGPAVAEADPNAAAAGAFGVHLASFADRVMAERGWVLLQRNHPAALGDLTPRIEDAKDDAGNPIFLLLAGPFQTKEQAAAHCRSIRSQVVFCKPRSFRGDELTAVQ